MSVRNKHNFILQTKDAGETRQIGEELGNTLARSLRTSLMSASLRENDAPRPNNIILALHGDLGAGKTTLTQGIAIGLGVDELVTSPTFTLVNEYAAKDGLMLLHVDTYRLGDDHTQVEREADAVGITELLETESAVIVIEWADRLSILLPPDYILITLETVDSNETGEASCFNENEDDENSVNENGANENEENLRSIQMAAQGSFSAEVLRLFVQQDG